MALLVVISASACVTITPVKNRGATSPTPAPTAVAAVPTDPESNTPSGTSPTKAPTRTPSDSPGTRTPKPRRAPATIDPNDPACTDEAHSLEGFHWNSVYRWHFNAESVPAGLDPDTTLAVIQTAFDNVLSERNDCGRPDTIHAKALYQGDTTQKPCTDTPDVQNTISFGELPDATSPDAIAYTCPFFGGPDADTRIAVDADIVILKDLPWSLSDKSCFLQYSLEATITHEVGHVFGLDHVTERDHGELTMSTTLDACDNSGSTLGLGDMLGLEELYGPGK
jgi:hypothetical protein